MRAAIASLVFLLSAPLAHADYRSEYAAYNKALAAGDYSGAAKHGEAAWRAAETELGEHKSTAVLAFNFAELVVIGEPRRAIEPYQLARALSQKMPTGLVIQDIDAGLAYAAFALALDEKQRRNALETALDDRRAKGLPASSVSAYGWLLLRAYEAKNNDRATALTFADRALADAEAMGEPRDDLLMRSALVGAAVSRLVLRSRDAQSVTEAVQYLERSFGLFPPQVDIDTFDPLLAQAIVWRNSADALAATEGLKFRTGSRLPVGDDYARAIREGRLQEETPWFVWRDAREIECAPVEWATQTPAKFPSKASDRSILGAALVGYDMSGDRVSRTVVLGESYASGFGAAAAKAVKTWKTKAPVAPECAKNHVAVTRFIYVEGY
jgi:tetratricopeptide (TPR) repeat protein